MYPVRQRLKFDTFIPIMIGAVSLIAALILTGSAAGAAPLPVRIVLRDNGFGFRNIAFRAKRVRLTVVNRGTQLHALEISRAQGAVAKTKELRPGEQVKLALALHPGNYRMFSPVDHDRAHGLSAPLKIIAPSPKGIGGAEMNRVFYDYNKNG